MATLRELKTRIGSVASSEKITGAMKMISSAKVHKFESSLKQLVPYREKIKSVMAHIMQTGTDFSSPLIETRHEVKKIALAVFGSDDGLCGAYNINIFKAALVEINQLKAKYGPSVDIDLYPIGQKMHKALSKIAGQHMHIVAVEGVDSKMEAEKVNEFTHSLRDRFSSGEYDLVCVEYMKFFSMSRQRPTLETLFPVSGETLLEGSDSKEANGLCIFEPDANSIFNAVLPMFVLSTMQEITIENRASEQAARVMAMQSANDNAKKLLEGLQLEYNKLRQESITTELLDILGGQVER
ncbi:MAG: ATP synthase F1 subunit gamma [Muribaculaceae bacterium]|nr:ATP synthase F1 subunit gamma [Muribaculaceae bacterium]